MPASPGGRNSKKTEDLTREATRSCGPLVRKIASELWKKRLDSGEADH
jgi:hypothetical protein